MKWRGEWKTMRKHQNLHGKPPKRSKITGLQPIKNSIMNSNQGVQGFT